MFALRGYQAYGNETWLEAVKKISANNTLYEDDTCGGGVLWLTYKPLIKNTITNSLYFSVLARLYRFTGDESYYYEAIKNLDWWLGWGIETDTGRVYDTLTAPACYTNGLQGFTYNSGAILFGLADLYYATGNTTLLDLGRTIAYAAMRDFTDSETGVLVEKCEMDPQPAPDLPPGCQQDEIVFKGILVLGMAEFYVARPDQNIYNFINTQMLSVVWNNVDKTWLMGEWWQQVSHFCAFLNRTNGISSSTRRLLVQKLRSVRSLSLQQQLQSMSTSSLKLEKFQPLQIRVLDRLPYQPM